LALAGDAVEGADAVYQGTHGGRPTGEDGFAKRSAGLAEHLGDTEKGNPGRVW
jgi:hypothetical protein